MGGRRADEPPRLHSLCGPCPCPRTRARKCHHHGQPLQPQGSNHACYDRVGGCDPDVSAALQLPIEMTFSNILTVDSRKAAVRTFYGLWRAIRHIVTLYSLAEYTSYIAAAGCDEE